MRTIHVALFAAAAIGLSSVSKASFASTEASLLRSSPTFESTSDDGAFTTDSKEAVPPGANGILRKIGNPIKGMGNAIRKMTGGRIGRTPKTIQHEGGRVERPGKGGHVDLSHQFGPAHTPAPKLDRPNVGPRFDGHRVNQLVQMHGTSAAHRFDRQHKKSN